MTSHLTVGIVGCGAIAPAHLRAWSKVPGFTVRGVFDLDQDNARKRAAEFKVGTVYEQIDRLIAECDVVDVCTPPQTHARIARDVLAAGHHLVIEKPMVTDVTDWEELHRLALANAKKIAVIHNLKFLHSVRMAKTWVDEGRIGTVIRVQREFMTHADHDRMLVGDKHWSHRLPGGRWFETLPHELYLTHWFVGPLAVGAITALSTPDAPPGAPADEVIINLRGERCLATIHFSANCRQNRRMFVLQGTEGRIEVDLLSDFATLTTTRDNKWKRAVGGIVIDAGKTLMRTPLDRSRYGLQHARGESPHGRIIASLGKSLLGQGEEPTPLAEVDYVVRNCDVVGREIDRQVAAARAR
jgi:UDP-N-acetyl-2-amino-2-deoxyglucuronate dehydrogenase